MDNPSPISPIFVSLLSIGVAIVGIASGYVLHGLKAAAARRDTLEARLSDADERRLQDVERRVETIAIVNNSLAHSTALLHEVRAAVGGLTERLTRVEGDAAGARSAAERSFASLSRVHERIDAHVADGHGTHAPHLPGKRSAA